MSSVSPNIIGRIIFIGCSIGVAVDGICGVSSDECIQSMALLVPPQLNLLLDYRAYFVFLSLMFCGLSPFPCGPQPSLPPQASSRLAF
jgi:hypothetical protein